MMLLLRMLCGSRAALHWLNCFKGYFAADWLLIDCKRTS
jgi:hypothetical protein